MTFIFRDTTVNPNKFWLCTDLSVDEISEQECIAFNKGLGSSSISLDASNIVRLQQVRDATNRVRTRLVQDVATQVPVTVQGASEQFINGVASQIVVNTNTVGSQLAAVGATYRDQIRSHVTTEADRIITAV